MRQLKQQGATGAQKGDGFPVDPPRHRARPKNALDWSRGPSPDEVKSKFDVAFGDQMRTLGSRRGVISLICAVYRDSANQGSLNLLHVARRSGWEGAAIWMASQCRGGVMIAAQIVARKSFVEL
ncbi:hypothetical protein [Bradyrhizobium sp. USDA 4504]